MATIVVPDVSERVQLDTLMGNAAPIDIHLYSNNYIPDSSSLIGSFTEATYSGYVAETPDFSAAVTGGDGRAHSYSDTISFPLAGSGSQTVYGWYATDGSGNLFAALRFDSSVTVSTTVAVPDFVIDYRLRQEP